MRVVLQSETLRLFPSILAVSKYTQSERKLRIDGQDCTIAPKAMAILNLTAVPNHPKYRGEDSLVWRPSRWIDTKAPSRQVDPLRPQKRSTMSLEHEAPRSALSKAFFPRSDGNSVCHGKRYAQVEFVAVLSTPMRQMVWSLTDWRQRATKGHSIGY